jgi:nucleoside 2-deoxyribosyltransferase
MLERIGYEVLDPWKLTPDELIQPIIQMPFGEEKRRAWRDMNLIIGRNNAEAIFRSHVVFAELDGVDVDSGTAAEIGFAGGMNMCSLQNIRIVGYRGDFRLSADNIGSTVNLQVEYFIRT